MRVAVQSQGCLRTPNNTVTAWQKKHTKPVQAHTMDDSAQAKPFFNFIFLFFSSGLPFKCCVHCIMSSNTEWCHSSSCNLLALDLCYYEFEPNDFTWCRVIVSLLCAFYYNLFTVWSMLAIVDDDTIDRRHKKNEIKFNIIESAHKNK